MIGGDIHLVIVRVDGCSPHIYLTIRHVQTHHQMTPILGQGIRLAQTKFVISV